jgi:hypothetical protein
MVTSPKSAKPLAFSEVRSLSQPYEITGDSNRVRSRRVEDRIRDLCAKVTAAPQTELQAAITNLQVALREHALRIENKAVKDLLKGLGKPDRRKR